MGRVYAGILGPLAMAVVICRGWLASGGVEGTLTLAIVYLAVFALLGAILGHIAQTTIDESVRARLEQQLPRGASWYKTRLTRIEPRRHKGHEDRQDTGTSMRSLTLLRHPVMFFVPL